MSTKQRPYVSRPALSLADMMRTIDISPLGIMYIYNDESELDNTYKDIGSRRFAFTDNKTCTSFTYWMLPHCVHLIQSRI